MGKFSKYLNDLPDGKKKCIICSHEFNKQKDSSTNVFKYHFSHKHPKEWNKLTGNTEKLEETDDPPMKRPFFQKTLEQSFSEYESDGVKSKRIERAVMQLISSASLPLSIVDNVAWKNFTGIAIPRFKNKSRHYYQRTVLPEVYMEYKDKLFRELKNASNISLSFDGWNDSSNKHQYLGVIVHFIEKDELTFRLLGTIDISAERHTGEYIKRKITEILEEFEVSDKLVACVRDGASNVKLAAELLDRTHFDCMAHKLNLAVRDGIDTFQNARSILDKFKKLCKIINKSGNLRREYEQISETFNIPALSLKKHIEVSFTVRWNTVHAVFERALKVKEVIDYLSSEHADWPQLSGLEWSTVESTVAILQPIVDATLLIQNRGMTSSAIIPLCTVLIGELNSNEKFQKFCQAITGRLQSELAKYENNEYLQFGTMVDVRFKGDYTNEEWKKKLLLKMYETQGSEVEDTDELSEVSGVKENAFSRFLKGADIKNMPKPATGSRREAIHQEFLKWFEQKSDIDQNPIYFWNRAVNKGMFPTLHSVHKLYLCSPATTAEAERLFSSARTILTDNRKILSSENFSRLLFLQKNIRLMGFGCQNSRPDN
ncbi:hypothetical protein CRE_16523 [Caenorhabditis remanei]|uniref:HAT C-terminal dimerisation domain-containing protein n=1 Tax=Caenorhabditis remanei TaxID=31234 RepID=E3NNW7_CAERE|nr:hypothetical protein CRE_16523 [Caenorhabditis remanei]